MTTYLKRNGGLFPIENISDHEMEHIFEQNPFMKDLLGYPIYWSPSFGYWPSPAFPMEVIGAP